MVHGVQCIHPWGSLMNVLLRGGAGWWHWGVTWEGMFSSLVPTSLLCFLLVLV